MKTYYIAVITIVLSVLYGGCVQTEMKKAVPDVDGIITSDQQDSLFAQLMDITGEGIDTLEQADSLAFLIVPLRESCPSCLDKTIDSILKYKDNLREKRFVVISLKGGRKSAGSYFTERRGEMPEMPGELFLDTVNKAADLQLCRNNPAIYYTANNKVYKRVYALPETIKKDLHSFFKFKK